MCDRFAINLCACACSLLQLLPMCSDYDMHAAQDTAYILIALGCALFGLPSADRCAPACCAAVPSILAAASPEISSLIDHATHVFTSWDALDVESITRTDVVAGQSSIRLVVVASDPSVAGIPPDLLTALRAVVAPRSLRWQLDVLAWGASEGFTRSMTGAVLLERAIQCAVEASRGASLC